MSNYKLKANERTITGRKVKALRRDGLIPANVFGKDLKSYAISVDSELFRKAYKESGETGIIELEVGKKKNPVLIANVQVHPVSTQIIHVDFRQIDLTKKITATVPVEIVGESPAEKASVGTVVQQITELEVEALPVDLPEKFEVDVSGLVGVDQAFYIKDLTYDKSKVSIDAEEDQIIAKVEPPQKEVVIEAPAEGQATEGVEAGDAANEEPASESSEEGKSNS